MTRTDVRLPGRPIRVAPTSGAARRSEARWQSGLQPRRPPSAGARLNAEELLGYYREMLLIRRFEERAGQLYGLGLIGGFCHLYIGQEAVAVGMQSALTAPATASSPATATTATCWPTAWTQRGHGRADRPRRGYSKGKGGSMHMFSREKDFYGGHGIVGAQVPLGTGLAFAHSIARTAASASPIFGDGAVNQGQVYESFNMAALWKLPVVYVIENNHYAMGTASGAPRPDRPVRPRRRPTASPACRSTAWTCSRCAARPRSAWPQIRAGKGPIILEMLTYRYRGHSMSDPAKYRTQGRGAGDARASTTRSTMLRRLIGDARRRRRTS